ncbi:MAG: hypothetical protein DMF78_20325 [Acidobacteria bacterium]|nr:MAG: hypothetical protein DMF78_20325 [Acidobacteriota bacterium]
MRAARRGEAGVTLIEMIIVLAITLIVAEIVYKAARSGWLLYQTQTHVAERGFSGLRSIDDMAVEIARAGFGLGHDAEPVFPGRGDGVRARDAITLRSNPGGIAAALGKDLLERDQLVPAEGAPLFAQPAPARVPGPARGPCPRAPRGRLLPEDGQHWHGRAGQEGHGPGGAGPRAVRRRAGLRVLRPGGAADGSGRYRAGPGPGRSANHPEPAPEPRSPTRRRAVTQPPRVSRDAIGNRPLRRAGLPHDRRRRRDRPGPRLGGEEGPDARVAKAHPAAVNPSERGAALVLALLTLMALMGLALLLSDLVAMRQRQVNAYQQNLGGQFAVRGALDLAMARLQSGETSLAPYQSSRFELEEPASRPVRVQVSRQADAVLSIGGRVLDPDEAAAVDVDSVGIDRLGSPVREYRRLEVYLVESESPARYPFAAVRLLAVVGRLDATNVVCLGVRYDRGYFR